METLFEKIHLEARLEFLLGAQEQVKEESNILHKMTHKSNKEQVLLV